MSSGSSTWSEVSGVIHVVMPHDRFVGQEILGVSIRENMDEC